MDFNLSEELQMLRDMVRDFATEKIAPFANEWTKSITSPMRSCQPMGSWAFRDRDPGGVRRLRMGWLAAMIVTERLPGPRARCGADQHAEPRLRLHILSMAARRSRRNTSEAGQRGYLEVCHHRAGPARM